MSRLCLTMSRLCLTPRLPPPSAGLAYKAITNDPNVSGELYFGDGGNAQRIRVLRFGPLPSTSNTPSITPSPSASVCMPCICAERTKTSSQTPSPTHSPNPSCRHASEVTYTRYHSFAVDDGTLLSTTSGVSSETQ